MRSITVLSCVLALSMATPALAVPADGDRTVSNAKLTLTVTIRDGRLFLENLQGHGAYGVSSFKTDGGFSAEIVWTDWQAPAKADNADNEIALSAVDIRIVDESRGKQDGGETLRMTFEGPEQLGLEITWTLPSDAAFVRRQLRLFDPKDRGHFLHRLWSLDAARLGAQQWTWVHRGGFGQPLAFTDGQGGVFLGLEWPASQNDWTAPPLSPLVLRCGQEIGEVITKDGVSGEPVVMGLAPDVRVKLAFMDYLDTIRAGRLRPYTLYNSWYDLRSAEYPRVRPEQVMNETNVQRIIGLLRENMIRRHGITLDAFVLDDGWDVYESDWVLRPKQFPNGLKPIVDELKKTGTRLGIWFGPIGGYSFRQKRVDWMKERGYETVGDQMWFGGPKYSALLTQRVTEMAKEGVGYFKWDGFQFVASGPGLGTPPGIYSRRAVLKKVEAMASAARAANPGMFLNITSGTWLSPWWLKIADQIWMSGEDYGSADVPSISTRDSSITYRDLVLYEDFAKTDHWFPIANLMTHGILKGTIDIQDIGKGEPLTKFADEVVFYLARGVTMHELYISPDILSEKEWTVLADALRWARDRFPLLSRTEMVGGDPNKREPYGYAHFRGNEGIVAVRNPGVEPTSAPVRLVPELGLDPSAQDLVVERIYPTRWVAPRLYRSGERLEVTLQGYEAAVYEIRPLASHGEPLLAGAVFEEVSRSDGKRDLAVLEAGAEVKILDPGGDTKPAPKLSLPSRAPIVDGPAVDSKGAVVAVSFTLAASAREATLAVLLRPNAPDPSAGNPVVQAIVDGKPVPVERVEAKGLWSWHTVRVEPGTHRASFNIAAGKDGKGWAGDAQVWLTAAERVEPAIVSLPASSKPPALRPLPSTGRGALELPRSVRLGEAHVEAP